MPTLANGKIDARYLRDTSGGKPLFFAAADAFERLALAFKARFGKALVMGPGATGYRTYQQQVDLFHALGYPKAAVPGTSNHGLGLASDLSSGVQIYASDEWKWMNTVGRTYGYTPLNEKNLTFEPWHWVYSVADDDHYNDDNPPVTPPVVVPPTKPAEEDDMVDVAWSLIRTDGPTWALVSTDRPYEKRNLISAEELTLRVQLGLLPKGLDKATPQWVPIWFWDSLRVI